MQLYPYARRRFALGVLSAAAFCAWQAAGVRAQGAATAKGDVIEMEPTPLIGQPMGSADAYGGAGMANGPTPVGAMQVHNLGPAINTTQDEYTPFVAPSGQFLFFQSNRVGGYGGHDLWYSMNKAHVQPDVDGKWTIPRNMDPPVNSADFEGMPSLLFHGDGSPRELYFTAGGDSRPSLGLTDLYVARFQDGKWTAPENLVPVNSPFHDRMPSISADGNKLYFSSDRPGGYGKADLWVATRLPNGLGWSEAVNLGPLVNGPRNEFCPSAHQNGHTLYFSSDRPGGMGGSDIYYSHAVGAMWQAPKAMSPPINSAADDEYPTATLDGRWLYFASDRAGGYGGFDLFRGRLPLSALPPMYVRFEGVVFDGDPALPYEKTLGATLKIGGGDQPILMALKSMNVVDPQTKSFSVLLPAGKKYAVEISYPNYYPAKTILNYDQVAQNGQIDRQKFTLYPIGKQPVAQSEMKIPAGGMIQIVGKVIDKLGGQPIPAAQIGHAFGYMPDPNSPQKLITGPEGAFTFALPPNQLGKDLYITTYAAGYKSRQDKVAGDLIQGPEQQLIIKLESLAGAGTSGAIVPGGTPNLGVTAEVPLNPAPSDKLLAQWIYFPLGSDNWTLASQPKLDAILAHLAKNPAQGAILEGHTDHLGEPQFNELLSWKRAKAVYDYLRAKGVDKQRLIVRYAGMNKQVKPNAATEADRALNRRVEWAGFKLGTLQVIDPVPPYGAPAPKPAPKKWIKPKAKPPVNKFVPKKKPAFATDDYIIEDGPPAKDKDEEVF